MSSSPKNSKPALFQRLAKLYARMEEEYDALAAQLGLSCAQCSDNCCTSYFQHHTYIEWAYLWEGIDTLDPRTRDEVLARARDYVDRSRSLVDQGERPQLMCPLNDGGWCTLYPYRLMICRLHGVPNMVRMPNGQVKRFPGCSTCQQLTGTWAKVPVVDRTPLYIELVQLERDFVGPKRKSLPKVDMTLSEMLVQGRPPL